MSIKFRLTIMSFLQFFVWGAWLITIGTYCFNAKGWTGAQFGAIFSTLALSSLFMPALTGIIADKWMNAERLYGILHILYGAVLFYVPYVNDPDTLYYVIFAAMIFYMPTISLSNSIAYNILKNNKFDVVKVFPPIRVWGTIGFIAAMWITNLTGSKANANQFLIGGAMAIVLGLYSFSLPKCPPQKSISKDASILEQLGLSAFKLFANSKMALFFLFSMCLGAALQLTNMYGDSFISDFGTVPKYAEIINTYKTVILPHLHQMDGFFDKVGYIFGHLNTILPALVVQYSTVVMSISQISETIVYKNKTFIPNDSNKNSSIKVYDCANTEVTQKNLVLTENSSTIKDNSANKSMLNAKAVKDFWKKIFNRDSIDGQGLDILLNIHYMKDFSNAFWDGEQMIFGDGDKINFTDFTTCLDIVGHELGHGIVQFVNDLNYSGQSGALNEHFADVFGISVKQWYNKETAQTSDWLLGKDCLIGKYEGFAIRSFKDPGNPNIVIMAQPDNMSKFYKGVKDDNGVHINSGILNKAFYIVACDMGTIEACRLWFLVLPKLKSKAVFKDLAKNLIKLSDKKHLPLITKAFSQVGIINKK